MNHYFVFHDIRDDRQATVEMLREDEEKTNAERLAQHEREQQETRDRLVTAKAARKAEAIARSNERMKVRVFIFELPHSSRQKSTQARAAIDAANVQLGASATVLPSEVHS